VVLRPPPRAGAGPVAEARAPVASRPGRAPWLLVGAAVAWNLINLRAEALGVAYLDDSSVHAQMVRLAARQLGHGHLPLTSWFPFLGLGSPLFLHYQSLPSMLTGLIGLVVGPDVAFRWTLYLLLSLWPVSVYFAARLFGAGRTAAAASAAMSPFLVSATGIGYEQNAYLWTGFGVWTQLWASLTLPLAWGLSWTTIRRGRGYFAATALVSLTIALHFETGYLALIPLALWPFVAGPNTATRVLRGAILLVGSLLASAWVIVPLIDQRTWSAVNESLQGTPLVNGYGAGRVVGWLVSGQLLDHGRLPVVTLFAGAGLFAACARCRRDANARALLVVLAACLIVSSGRATFGALADVIPGGGDIFFRRFMMGIQLAALLLAGEGAVWSARTIRGTLGPLARRPPVRSWRPVPRAGLAPTTVLLAAAIIVLAPAWLQLGSHDARNAAAIDAQRRADAAQGAELDRLTELIRARGGGRVYAGTASNWGVDFTVGAVPVFKYLESRDVDVVGYTLRTASLMSGPESHFDEVVPSDYRLFAIHYLILPSGWSAPIPARPIMRAGPYRLWSTESSGYVDVGRIVGQMTADRSDLGTRSVGVLRSGLAQQGDYLRVAFGEGDAAALRGLPRALRGGSAGSVTAETDDLGSGEAAATVRLRQPGVVVLSVSFDPGWTASVDGHLRTTMMVAPALVGVAVSAGTHRVVFRYRGFRGYPILFTLSAVTLAGVLVADLIRRRRRSSVTRPTLSAV
jgi:hypothetical protein